MMVVVVTAIASTQSAQGMRVMTCVLIDECQTSQILQLRTGIYASGNCGCAKGQSLVKAHASVIIIIIIADHDQAVHVCACL